MIYDYLVIGQGLAGTTLSYQLIKRGKSVLVIDAVERQSASRVAAGLFNPFTGPRMVKTWMAGALFPYLHVFYRELEELLQTSLLVNQPIYRPFADQGQQNDWQGKWTDPRYRPFIEEIVLDSRHGHTIFDDHGGIVLRQSGWLKVGKLIDSYRKYLAEKGLLLDDQFIEKDLVVKNDKHLVYKGFDAKRLVDCRGYRSKSGSLFGWLPMVPVKGEILQIETENQIQTLFNRRCFIIPEYSTTSVVGSTYKRDEQSAQITEQGRREIIGRLEALLKLKYKVVGQRAGIRPATVARRPLLGIHPEMANVAVFNGLGSKGVSLAPFFSNQLVDKLEKGHKLNPEVDISRYYSLYFAPY